MRIECNMTANVYNNDECIYTIHEFFITRITRKISETPAQIIYPPIIIAQSITDLIIRITDQDGRLIFMEKRSPSDCMYEDDSDNVKCLY